MNMRDVRRVADKTEEVRRDVTAAGRDIWLAGLGALGRAETEGREIFESLVRRGRKVEGEQFRAIDRGVARTTETLSETLEEWGERLQEAVEVSVENVLHSVNLPSRQDLNRLSSRLDTLSRKVEDL